MKINKIYDSIIQPLRISSNKAINRSAPRVAVFRGLRIHPHAIAHGHDKNIFADSDISGIDATTFEFFSYNNAHEAPHQKKVNASIVTSFAVEKAKKRGILTANERIHAPERNMPYGFCVQQDKKAAENLLLSLKKKYNKI